MVDSQWLNCGECTEDTPVTGVEDTTISDNKITESTTEVGITEVSKDASIESSGDYNDDTETSLESEEDKIDHTELNGKLDVPKKTKGKSLLCFIEPKILI